MKRELVDGGRVGAASGGGEQQVGNVRAGQVLDPYKGGRAIFSAGVIASHAEDLTGAETSECLDAAHEAAEEVVLDLGAPKRDRRVEMDIDGVAVVLVPQQVFPR